MSEKIDLTHWKKLEESENFQVWQTRHIFRVYDLVTLFEVMNKLGWKFKYCFEGMAKPKYIFQRVKPQTT